jgi:cell fate regulator YaaT (PSP1 superfamily)
VDDVVGLRFDDMPKVYFFLRNRLNIKVGDWVVVETDTGEGIGIIVGDYCDLKLEGISHELKRVLRRASEKDLQKEKLLKEKQEKALALCLQKAKEYGLEMNLVKVQYFFDESKAVFYFTAESRVDFRELVKELARTLGTRIEMRQIGVRDKAKLVGGIGSCGREVCCKSFLQDFEPVSVRMAKDQNLTLNPSKISGVCGRLMCCLTFEHGVYKDLGKDLPKCGKKVKLEDGLGKVTRQNPLDGTVVVTHEDGREIQLTREELESILSETEE